MSGIADHLMVFPLSTWIFTRFSDEKTLLRFLRMHNLQFHSLPEGAVLHSLRVHNLQRAHLRRRTFFPPGQTEKFFRCVLFEAFQTLDSSSRREL